MNRFVCVHAHLYQPPRENPGLEAIECQDSAYPYHDWNERITAECYRPNAAARILDDEDRIVDIVNNYSRISFNVGATLLSWMERHAPRVYARILEADRDSQERFSGHGSALAQVYHHAIMPLCNDRDRRTQVVWGIRDFETRFGRRPEGMWLAETAVDLATLELLAEHGIGFTILAPRQAARIRRLGAEDWIDVGDGSIDPKRAYRQRLPSGRTIDLFFYDGPISQAIAFESLLGNGGRFANRLMQGFKRKEVPQLLHVATDGETYGHHHRFGEMALAFALDRIEREGLARLTNYGEFLEQFPAEYEVEIFENSSWSCAHGIERWRSDCGCNTGRGQGWNQAWRGPLREALDLLRDEVAGRFEQQVAAYLKDPWAARDAYVEVLVDPSAADGFDRFLGDHALRHLAAEERLAVRELLEMQRHALHMFTSCGWFFDDLAGIETIQVLAYAARVIQLADRRFDVDLGGPFLERLEQARSNEAELGDGRQIWERSVLPGLVDLEQVVAHHAVRTLFELEPMEEVYCFTVRGVQERMERQGERALVSGLIEVTSGMTGETARYRHAFVHFGGHDLQGAVIPATAEEAGPDPAELFRAFGEEDRDGLLGAIEAGLGAATFTLRSLFRDDLHQLVGILLRDRAREVELEYRRIQSELMPLVESLSDLNMKLPRVFRPALEFALNSELSECLESDPLDAARVRELIQQSREEQVRLDGATLGHLIQERLVRAVDRWSGDEESADALVELETWVRLARSMPFEVDLWRVQNACFEQRDDRRAEVSARAAQGDGEAVSWLERFDRLLGLLAIREREA